MSKLLYIRLRKEESFEFGVPVSYRGLYNEVLDLDNFSDAQTVNYALKFIEKEPQLIVLDAVPEASLGQLIHLVNRLKECSTSKVEFRGEHRFFNMFRNQMKCLEV